LIGQEAEVMNIIKILATVFKMSLKDLARELNMREDSLKIVLKRMEKQGLVILESGGVSSHKPGVGGKPIAGREKSKAGRGIYVRYLGYKKEEGYSEIDNIMYG